MIYGSYNRHQSSVSRYYVRQTRIDTSQCIDCMIFKQNVSDIDLLPGGM